MINRLILLLTLTLTLNANTICTQEYMDKHPLSAGTCQMYDELSSQKVDFKQPGNHIDYETEESHKIFLQGSFYPTPIDKMDLSNHFGFWQIIKTISVDQTLPPKQKPFIKVISKPIPEQKEVLFCDAEFDLFTVLTYTNKDGFQNDIITFIDRNKDIYQQLENFVSPINVDTKMGKQTVAVNKDFDLYCGKIKTNRKAVYEWTSPPCEGIRLYEEGNANETIKNDIMAGNIYKDEVYVGEMTRPRKMCVINYRKELNYQSNCLLSIQDILINLGETEEDKIRQIREKYTSDLCCGKYPNAFVTIENPFEMLEAISSSTPINELIKENLDQLGLSDKIKCTVNTVSSGYESNFIIEKKVEPSIENPISLGCGGITYTGAYEQNVIDRLSNLKHVLNEATKPYTKCCDDDAMSEIQRYGQIYSLTMCYEEVGEMLTMGMYEGQKISKDLIDIHEVCMKHFGDAEIKSGGMMNFAFDNVGTRAVASITSIPNYFGCIQEEIGNLDIVNKLRTCYDENYKQYFEFINWLVSQQLTLDLGVDRLRTGFCESSLDRSSTIDLSINLNDFIPGIPKIEEVKPLEETAGPETTRIEDGKNYYGVIKKGNQYVPSLTLQDQYAFERTNLSSPYMGMNPKEEPTYFYSEFGGLLGLQFNSSNINTFEDKKNICKERVFENSKKIIEGKLGPIKSIKTIDGYVLLYAENGKLINTGKYLDIGLFEGANCERTQKEVILRYFNKSLGNYIVEYLKNKPKSIKEAELGLIRQDLPEDTGGNFVDFSATTNEQVLIESEIPKNTDFNSKEEYIQGIKSFITEIKEVYMKQSADAIREISNSIKNECSKLPHNEVSECVELRHASIDAEEEKIKKLNLRIVKAKEILMKHEEGSVTIDKNVASVEDSVNKFIGALYKNKYMGNRYVWGGTSPTTGWDCSGFTQFVAKNHLGVGLPRQAMVQAEYQGDGARRIKRFNDVKKGDFLYFWATYDEKNQQRVTHTGISLGGTKMMHASSGDQLADGSYTGETEIKNMSVWWTTDYRKEFAAGRRGHWYRGLRFLLRGDEPINEMVEYIPHSQYGLTPLSDRKYDQAEYERVLKKYVKEETNKSNPMYLKKKSLEIYQNMKRNKEINYYKNVDLLKKSIGVF